MIPFPLSHKHIAVSSSRPVHEPWNFNILYFAIAEPLLDFHRDNNYSTLHFEGATFSIKRFTAYTFPKVTEFLDEQKRCFLSTSVFVVH
jgi:hypothetical protein